MIKQFLIQKINFDNASIWEETREMYYRSQEQISRIMDEEGGYLLKRGKYDFFTYFNSVSYQKWIKYTKIKRISLELKIKGNFVLNLVGGFLDKVGQFHMEWIGHYAYRLEKETAVSLPVPESIISSVVSFYLCPDEDCRLFDAYYTAEVDDSDIREPSITLITTTFKKEGYIKDNINTLKKSVFYDQCLAGHFNWIIVDNGSTLKPEEFESEWLKILPNRNVGGSGGFCRGMLEVLSKKQAPTHILLMDDDVCVYPESFRRLYYLLSFLRPEYTCHFISGAMLENNQRNIQHEDIGEFKLNGGHGPIKNRCDLNSQCNIVKNEDLFRIVSHAYAGWWYCCIPMSVVNKSNLPMPFFVRGDDVEYSIRNHAEFITMNGICIWHEGFGTKFSGALEYYQVHRNDLILQSMHPQLSDVKLMERIKNMFWEQIFKFDYKGCDLLLDAVEDFLKGPEFIKQLDGEVCYREKREKDNQLSAVTESVESLINYETFFQMTPLTGFKLKWYGHFVNGQKLPEFLSGKKTAVIPYGWGYSQKALNMAGKVYAVDISNHLYTVFSRDRKKFRALNSRYKRLMKRFDREYESVSKQYRTELKTMTESEFWIRYLEIV